MKPMKITVTKALTKEQSKRWKREEFSIEVGLSEGDDPETAKNWAESLLDIWITKFEKA